MGKGGSRDLNIKVTPTVIVHQYIYKVYVVLPNVLNQLADLPVIDRQRFFTNITQPPRGAFFITAFVGALF